jgi:hypothetical protein
VIPLHGLFLTPTLVENCVTVGVGFGGLETVLYKVEGFFASTTFTPDIDVENWPKSLADGLDGFLTNMSTSGLKYTFSEYMEISIDIVIIVTLGLGSEGFSC